MNTCASPCPQHHAETHTLRNISRGIVPFIQQQPAFVHVKHGHLGDLPMRTRRTAREEGGEVVRETRNVRLVKQVGVVLCGRRRQSMRHQCNSQTRRACCLTPHNRTLSTDDTCQVKSKGPRSMPSLTTNDMSYGATRCTTSTDSISMRPNCMLCPLCLYSHISIRTSIMRKAVYLDGHTPW